MYSDTAKSLGKSITATGQTWSFNDTFVCNLIKNDSFENWTGYDVIGSPSTWNMCTGPTEGIIKATCGGKNCYVLGTIVGDIDFLDENGTFLDYVSVSATANGVIHNLISNPDGSKIYATVSGTGDNKVAVIDTATMTHTANIPVGVNPYGIAMTQFGSKLYVSNYQSGTVSVINPVNNTVIATITVGNSPIALIRNAANTKIYCINQGSNTISLIDQTTNTVTSTITLPAGRSPTGGVVAPDGRLYVLNSGNGSYTIIEADGATIGPTIVFGTSNSMPYNALYRADGTLFIFKSGVNDLGIVAISTYDNTIIDSVTTTGRQISGVFSYSGKSIIASCITSYNLVSFPLVKPIPDTWITETTISNGSGRSIAVGTNPYGFGITPDSTKAYVCNFANNNISVVNLATGAIASTIAVGTNPFTVGFNADGSKAFVCNYGSANLTIIPTAGGANQTLSVGNNPHGIAFSPSGTRAYVVNYGSGSVSVIDISSATPAVLTTIANVTGTNSAFSIAISPNGSKLYVTANSSNVIKVISTETNTVTGTINVGNSPSDIVFSPDGSRAYTFCNGTSQLYIINALGDTVSSNIAVSGCTSCMGLGISPDGNKLYLSYTATAGKIVVLDTTKLTVVSTVDVGNAPNEVHVSRDGNYLVCANLFSNSIHIFQPLSGGFFKVTDAKYGSSSLLLTNEPSAGKGETWQPVYLVAGVEYTFTCWVKRQNDSLGSSGSLCFALVDNGTEIKSASINHSNEFTQLKLTHTFSADPINPMVHFYINGTPPNNSGFIIDSVHVTETKYYADTAIGTPITTDGTVFTIPDIQVDGIGIASVTPPSTGPQHLAHDAEGTPSSAESWFTSYTETITGTAGVATVITGAGMQYYTSNNDHGVLAQITVTGAGYNSGQEKVIVTTGTTDYHNTVSSPKSLSVSGIKLQFGVGANVTVKYQIKTANDEVTAHALKFYVDLTGGSSGGVNPFPANVEIYNTADQFTRLGICNSLFPGCSIRVNADGTGFYRYSDFFDTNVYLSVAQPPTGVVTWNSAAKTITISSGGALTYCFNTKFPVTGLPVLTLYVVSGAPQITIANNTGQAIESFYTIDGNSNIPIYSTLKQYGLNAQTNCSLAGSTIFYIRIAPPTGTSCTISSIYLYADIVTVDAEKPNVNVGGTNTFKIEMDGDAACNVNLYYPDRKWGI
jgi:YVTN family beta-propeller protein